MTEMEPNPLNREVRTQRDGIGTDRENNVQITQPSGNVIPSIGLGESTPIPNVNIASEILDIPSVDRSTSIPSRDRIVITENVRIGQNYPCEGTDLQGTSIPNRRDNLEESSDDNRSYRS